MNNNTINTEVTMRDAAPAGGAKRFRPGDEILGRYVVEAELGQGGMGVVYLCLDKVAGVKVAVKGLPPEVSHNSDEMESVRENFQLVSELQHPNIAGVRTLEVDAATGNYYLIMAYARGTSLKHWLRQHGGKKHRAEQLKVLRQIALALDYAHNAEPRHIIHRDIKPENIMVDERGNVSVLDFGLAAQVKSSLSRVSQLVTSRSGTPAYKSPEQWLAQPQRAPSDQYALGVIAYQMYSGELPYDSDDVEILKHAVAFDPVPEILDEGKDINAVFAKVLAKKANERFPSCTAFVDALEGKKAEDQIRERMRELDRERKIQEEERRKQEAVQREQALAERKRREEQEKAERKRREDAELVSLAASIDNLKQEIRIEHERVSAYLSGHPEYLDSRQVAAGLKGLVYEEAPKDLQGAREFNQKLETALSKLKGLISGLDMVVCATVDGREVDGATMLYGERVLSVPVRIKRKERLSKNDCYKLQYSCSGQEYVGQFSFGRVQDGGGQCVMVPLRPVPSMMELTKTFVKRNCLKYIWGVLVALLGALEISAIAAEITDRYTRSDIAALACFFVVAISMLSVLYAKLMRREVSNVLCCRDEFLRQGHSTYKESELLLDRRPKPTSKRSRGGAGDEGALRFGVLAKAFYCSLLVSILVWFLVGCATGSMQGAIACGAVSAVLTFVISCRMEMRRERWHLLIARDRYRENPNKLPAPKENASTNSLKGSTPKAVGEKVKGGKSGGWKWLFWLVGVLVLAVGIGCLVGGWPTANSASATGSSRRHDVSQRSEIARERKEAARVQFLKAETERLAREKRKADEERVAAEEAARKAREEAERVAAQRRKAEAERIAAEKRKAEEARVAEEKAEAERKAKEDAERAVAEASQRAIELFKKGDWQSGLKQAEKSNQDDAELLFWLGTCYDIGLGANCDAGKAVGYFRRAAEKGQVDAQCELGRRYEMGQGVAKDLVQAKRWYQTAASQGSKAAEGNLRRVYDLENASAREASLARERAQKEREEAERKAREAEEAEKVRKLQEELAQLKETAKSVREEPATRTVPTSDRTRRKFDGTPTMTLLKFSSKVARSYYEKAAESARDGAHNKAKVKADYEKGRECGGPVWPELEAWLEWWK